MEIDEILKETIKKLQSILLDFLDNSIKNKCTLDDIFDSHILFNKCKELIIEKKIIILKIKIYNELLIIF